MKKQTKILILCFTVFTLYSANSYASLMQYSMDTYLIEGSDGPRWMDVCGSVSGNQCSNPNSRQYRDLSWAEKIAYYTIKMFDTNSETPSYRW